MKQEEEQLLLPRSPGSEKTCWVGVPSVCTPKLGHRAVQTCGSAGGPAQDILQIYYRYVISI